MKNTDRQDNTAVLSEQIYQERINFLMRREKNQVCAVYIDVTKDQMLAVESRTLHRDREEMKEQNVKHWLEKYIYSSLVYEDEKKKFCENFRRAVLLERFEQGKKRMEFHHCYYDRDRQKKMYQIEVNTFQNPNNGHIEACAIWKDETTGYIDEKIRKIMYQKDYVALGIIDIDRDEIYFRSFHSENVKVELGKRMPYSQSIQELGDRMLTGNNREILDRCASIEYIREHLRIAGHYSFQFGNVNNHVQRCTYYWFDEKRKLILTVVDDMTRQQETDSVTGGLNREGFIHRTEEILQKHSDEEFSIIYFNIQRFKAVNDLWGYETGDEMLRSAMNTLQVSFLKPLVVARVEADRFTILIKRKNLDLEKLPELLHRTHTRKNTKIEIYGRCGIYHIPKGCDLKVSDMCDRAKLAKMAISNRYARPYEVFNETMNRDYERRSMALMNLDAAIKMKEIRAYYQPVYDAWTKKIVSAEALARWDSVENGKMFPDQFIPTLEESGYITKMDHEIYEQVRKFQKKRRDEGKSSVQIAMNLSRMDLMNQEFIDEIMENTKGTDGQDEGINYEITESAYTVISEKGVEFLKAIRKEGGKLLIDDFGSGMSSFSTMRDYDFDIIKLDMGFVQKIGMDRKSNHILIALIDLAHHLEMKVVAEGVETKEQAEFLKNYGCDYLQGYYFSKPVTQEEFEQLLDAHEKNV